MVDEIINASPSKFRFPEAGLRVMVTSHFGPKTRLRMASRLIITEVRRPVVAPEPRLLFLCCCCTFKKKKRQQSRSRRVSVPVLFDLVYFF